MLSQQCHMSTPHVHQQVASPTPDCVCFDACVDELQHVTTYTHAYMLMQWHVHTTTTQVAYSQCRHPAAVRNGVEHAPKHGHPPASSGTLHASMATTPCKVVHEHKHRRCSTEATHTTRTVVHANRQCHRAQQTTSGKGGGGEPRVSTMHASIAHAGTGTYHTAPTLSTLCMLAGLVPACAGANATPTLRKHTPPNVAATNIHPHSHERCASTRHPVVLSTRANAPVTALNALTSRPWACNHAPVFATSAPASAPFHASLRTLTATPPPCSSSSLSTSKCSPTHASPGSSIADSPSSPRLVLEDPSIAGETQRHAAHKARVRQVGRKHTAACFFFSQGENQSKSK